MQETRQAMESFSPEKRELLELLLHESGAGQDDLAPASFAQERLWFLDQLETGGGLYNIPAAVRMSGALNVAALEASLSEIVRRHETLRTSFVASEGQPLQRIAPARPLGLPVLDLQSLPDAGRAQEAQRLTWAEARRPFDLSQGPLIRVQLLRLGQTEHRLLVTLHHIVADGWSLGLLVRELAALYAACLAGEGSPLPALPIQYADYAIWQREWMQAEVLDRQLDYWRRQLGSPLPVLELPTDRPRPAAQTSRGAALPFVLPAPLTRALVHLSRQENVTLFMTLLAAFQVLLHRYTGQDDILVGSPIANRRRAEVEGLIGLFVNTLVLRTDLSGRPTFRDLLGRVREVAMGAYAHQEAPFEKLVEMLQPERDRSRPPLFQVMFALQNLNRPDLVLPGLEVEVLEIDSGTAKFDLTLELVEEGERLRGSIEYNADLFDPQSAARMAAHFRVLLEAVAANPLAPIAHLPFLAESERHQILVDWNQTRADFPQAACLHELFQAQVERAPDSVAVVSGEQCLTYCELNRRANQLAHYLRTLGVGPEVLVCIYDGRSLEAVVSLLAVLKAGGAYLPLDPAYPAERIAFVLNDAGAPLVLTRSQLAGRLPPSEAQVVRLDSDWRIIAGHSGANPGSRTAGGNTAYVLYTSGSTGIPKGVSIPHQALVNHNLAIAATYGLNPADRILQFASLSFDVAAEEFYPSWLSGSTVVLRREEGLASFADFSAFVEQQLLTVLNLPASFWHEWVRSLAETRALLPPALRAVIAGSDVVSPECLARWQDIAGQTVRWWNAYGPTETTITAAVYEPRGRSERTIPIGRPLANLTAYILDRHMEPAPVGVPGELYIGGAGVARGYLNRPELTAERFVPDPFAAADDPFGPAAIESGGRRRLSAGGRLYKTGDLARYRPDGAIEYLGRVDLQVKVRGFRIEPGEIEAALSQHPGVRQAVVLARADEQGERKLAAYIVPGPGVELGASELRRHLLGKLPPFMIPAAFVFLQALPVSPNGKLDRKALPAPEVTGKAGNGAPQTPVEIVLAGLWANVLGVESAGAEDNFFELGGHSLLLTRLASKVRDTFQVDLPLHTFFEHPTLAALARQIDSARTAGCGAPAAPIRPAARQGVLPLSFAQQRLWFLDQLESHSPLYSIPSAIRLKGSVSHRVIEQSLNEIIRRHEALRTTFDADRHLPAQVIAPYRATHLPLIGLSHLPQPDRDSEARRLIDCEARRPFDLRQGPLFRALWLQLDDADQILIVNFHHIIADGWSLDVFAHELAALYRAFAGGQPSPLPDLPAQYADFAVWQRAWLQGEVLERQLAYWRRQLSDLPVLALPADRPRPALQTFRGAARSFRLTETLSAALKRLSQAEGVTLFMLLLAAFQALLARYSAQDDVVVGTPIANRNRAEIEPLIGFFVNTLALRADLSGDPTFREALRRVRHATLDAYDHQDIPFEKLVEALQPARDLSRNPLFQVMFIFQDASALRQLPGSWESVAVETGLTKFDLTLGMGENDRVLEGILEYNADLFDEQTIERMAAHFQVLLEGVAANPDTSLSALPLLTPVERQQILVEWNGPAAPCAHDYCLHQWFEAQAGQTPDAVALIAGTHYLTYRELNRRANQLAHFLQESAVGPECLVGVCLERSPAMIVALLAVLKAGAGYVPLDPAYPAERLAFILQDTRAPVVLSQQDLLARLPSLDARAICLDSEWAVIARRSPARPAARAVPEHPAYIIYTSGSTGIPKGVAISHRSAIALLHWAQGVFPLELRSGLLASTSICFDLSVFELFLPLCCGGTVVLAETALHLPDLPAAQAVRLVNSVPSAARELLRLKGLPASVRAVNLAGEPLGAELVEQLYRQPGLQQVYDLYGPSEDTTYSTYALRRAGAPATIGRPIANTQVYVLDRTLSPVPVGVPGEVYLGGAGLARGYLNRPDLTAERFVPNPFTSTPTPAHPPSPEAPPFVTRSAQMGQGVGPGARLYRTGDLARYRADGNLEFLGRIDHQVKVRGFRIELGEIETVLRQHPAVREAVALARGQGSDQQLVAYVVPQAEARPTIVELRRHLQEQLPAYMVPSAFVLLETLPLTQNGKLDRRALPAPAGERPDLGDVFVAPRTPAEKDLAAIWRELLGIERIGIHDNFFELGGHSLLLVQAGSRIRDSFQVELTLRALFSGPTIAEMAQAIAGQIAQRDPALVDEILEELKQLSPEEIQALLEAEGQPEHGPGAFIDHG